MFDELAAQGKEPVYYGGGTEIISFSRLYQLYPGAVIDLKGIPDCNTLGYIDGKLVIGAAVSLSQIQESGLFPLLSWCGGRVADHSIRNKITLGGNICAKIPYREAVLALLVSDSQLMIQGKAEQRRVNINEAFDGVLLLGKGEFLVQAAIDCEITKLPFTSYKTTANGDVGYPQNRIGYPVASAAGLKADSRVRAAFSGVCSFPFRSGEVEAALNDTGTPRDERAARAAKCLPSPILNDMEGSAGYREFVFKKSVTEMLERLEC